MEILELRRFYHAGSIESALQPGILVAVLVATLILNLGRYFIWSWLLHNIFSKWGKNTFVRRKFQSEDPSPQQIRNEIKWSVGSCMVYTAMSVPLYVACVKGWTALYLNWSDYGTGYAVLSFFLMVVLHDAYFYWAHRLSHINKFVFRKIHLIHHRSKNPTAYADIMFHPVDALIHVGFFPLFLFLIPTHPLVMAFFMFFVQVINALGHTGYEMFPRWFRRVLPVVSPAAAHNLHHSKVHCNYGLYFSFWDKVCGTEHKETEALFQKHS